MKQRPSSCLVLGAGLSGLMAATTLQAQGINVTVVDKGYKVGGRLASRSVAIPSGEQGLFDYGAQYFTAHDPRFRDWLKKQVEQGVIEQWAEGFSCSGRSTLSSQEQSNRFWRGTVSNRSVAQDLAKILDVKTQTRIEKLVFGRNSEHGQVWKAIATNGKSFFSDVVIITSPIPQTLQILDDSGILLKPEQRQKLEQVSYSRTIAILAVLDQESKIPHPGGLYVESDELMWVASNSQKGISSLPSVTLHATPEFSDRHWDDDKDKITQMLLQKSAPWFGKASVVAHHFHRWGYSQPTHLYGESFAAIFPWSASDNGTGITGGTRQETIQDDVASGDCLAPILLAGDAFGPACIASHLERAWFSGIAVANHLISLCS